MAAAATSGHWACTAPTTMNNDRAQNAPETSSAASSPTNIAQETAGASPLLNRRADDVRPGAASRKRNSWLLAVMLMLIAIAIATVLSANRERGADGADPARHGGELPPPEQRLQQVR